MAWNQWSGVSGGIADPRSSVTAVSAGDGNIVLMVAGVGGGVFTTIGNPTRGWARWTTVSEGQSRRGGNITAVPAGNGRFALFLADPGGGVFTASGSPLGGWSPWSSVSQGHAGPGVTVTAVPIGNGRFSVFLADPGGGVFTASGNAARGWSPWSSVSEGHAGPGVSVTAVAIDGGQIALFLADPGGGVFTASGSAARGWSRWTPVSEGRAGRRVSITALPKGDGRVALFLADPGGGVFTASGSASRGWSQWSSVSEGVAGPERSVTAVPAGDGRFALFLADPSGGVFATIGDANRGWGPWGSVSEGNSGPATSVAAVPAGKNRYAVIVADPKGGIFATEGDPVSADRNHPIKHVFVLVLENRSFDHMLGFSQITGTDAATGKPTSIDGLTGNESNPHPDGTTVRVSKGAPDQIRPDPGHNFGSVLEQLCGPVKFERDTEYPEPKNLGFVSNYAKVAGPERAGEVMKCFDPADVPVLTALAKEFVVCDRWYCSMPGPTEPNRYIMYAGSCGRFDDSPGPEELFDAVASFGNGFRFRNGATIFKMLDAAGVKWRIYAGDPFPVAAELDGINVATDRRDFEHFAKDLRDSSFDAGFVLIEPNYNVITLGEPFAGGNSQHPTGGVAAGERLIKATYEAIRRSPAWSNSMLIVTWDEHGGFYDHREPPRATPTGEPGGRHGFRFDRLGPRVPAVVVSPLIPKNLVEHRRYDHTAVAATLRRVFQLPQFDARDGISGGLDQLVTLKTARTDTPSTLPEAKPVAIPIEPARPNARFSESPAGLPYCVLHAALVQHLRLTPPDQHPAIVARVRAIKTRAEGVAYVTEVEQLVRSKRKQALTGSAHGGL